MRSRLAVIAALCVAFGLPSDGAAGECESVQRFHPRRKAFFGELHSHTSASIDAFTFDVKNDPRAAYAFAKGTAPVLLPDDTGATQSRTVSIPRPLDFAAVTDHSEGFGITRICTTPGKTGYDSPECRIYRGEEAMTLGPLTTPHRIVPSRLTLISLIAYVAAVPPNEILTCRDRRVKCDDEGISVWKDVMQKEANDAYEPCSFTSFVAYEWTAMPGTANVHHNVIFASDKVPEQPISYYETQSFDPAVLWRMLDEACHEGVPGCDYLTIPHNSNLSAGLIFPDPKDASEALLRQARAPLVEITQHKGASECRFDRFFNTGVDTTDELCAFEQLPWLTLLPLPGPTIVNLPPQLFVPRAFVRNALKDGLAIEQVGLADSDTGAIVHVNPFQMGFIGSTDTHNGTPGGTEERDFPGHVGNQDSSPKVRMTDAGIARANPGGLAVAWAEENTRASIFSALGRRETYGTSGTRPIVRFFGGWGFKKKMCKLDGDQFAKKGYDDGVPMGGELAGPPPKHGARPEFVVSALRDPDDTLASPLQRVQIVKGWVDAAGETHERVFDVAPAGEAFSAEVDPATCEAAETGSAALCTVWTDETFDPSQPAFYYARVLEDPTCRWHVADCRSLGVDPFAADCVVKALTAQPGSNLKDCCWTPELEGPGIDPVIQERAWTSPIWYHPMVGG